MLNTRQSAAKQTNVTRISVGAKLGNESVAYAQRTKSNGMNVTVYIVMWRRDALKARVLLGRLPSLGATAQQATRLAIRQNARMART